jgi:hypothetical protein
MAYKKFKKNDIFYNTLKAHPEFSFAIYNSRIYLNNKDQITGAYAANVGHVDTGFVSLYELNVDRSSSIAMSASYRTQLTGTNQSEFPYSYPNSNPATKADPWDERDIPLNTTFIHPFMVKSGFNQSFKSITKAEYNSLLYGELMTGSMVGPAVPGSLQYPMSASIVREHFTASVRGGPRANSDASPTNAGGDVLHQDGRNHLTALETTLNYYIPMNPHYAYSGSLGDKHTDRVTLISIPSIMFGSQIKKGSVTLDFYISGTLVGRLQDENQDGALIETAPSANNENSGSTAGVVLYNEGFLVLTGSWILSGAALGASNNDGYDNRAGTGQPASLPGKLAPKWIYFGAGANDHVAVGNVISSSFGLSFKGTTNVQTITMLAHADKGKLNHSNNPTYKTANQTTLPETGSTAYVEKSNLTIKNIVSSSYADPTGSFQKITYISSVGIYDEDKNLLGIAKMATPVKKSENREFTFKLKLDI